MATVTNTYSFDLGEADRNVSPTDVQLHISGVATGSTPPTAAPLRSALPRPVVTYEARLGSDGGLPLCRVRWMEHHGQAWVQK